MVLFGYAFVIGETGVPGYFRMNVKISDECENIVWMNVKISFLLKLVHGYAIIL